MQYTCRHTYTSIIYFLKDRYIAVHKYLEKNIILVYMCVGRYTACGLKLILSYLCLKLIHSY
jgi:hypothetical protein